MSGNVNDRVAVVAGVGPGLGRSLCLRFAREGYAVAALARRKASLQPSIDDAAALSGSVTGYPCDVTDGKAITEVFETVRQELGAPDIGIYNAGGFELGGILELDGDTFEGCWRSNCLGAFLFAQQALQTMSGAGRGTLIFTGATASMRGSARFSALAVGKSGLRALVQSLAREFGPQGIHAAHPIIDGQIYSAAMQERFPDRDRETFLDPDDIADTYWELYRQAPSAWTLELDLRPHVEDF